MLGVLSQVEVGAVGDALQLVPAPGKCVLDIDRAGRVVRELVGIVGPDPEILLGHAERRGTTGIAPSASTRTTPVPPRAG